ncbi:MAG: site-specific integrase [Lachnospiraceae bacterium]|nr:site-specific integrase [Lachnospiraceae bacterium]
MSDNIDLFIEYMKTTKNASENTLQSYKRDLNNMAKYFAEQGIDDVSRINGTNINSYILYLEKNGKSAATIARNVSSIKTFFRCMINHGQIKREPTENVQAPQNDNKKTEALSEEEMNRIIESITGDEPKELRDRAMIRLIMDAGLKVSEVLDICLTDINLQYGFVTCHGRKKDKTVKFSDDTSLLIRKYLDDGRGKLIKKGKPEVDSLFLNCFGNKMSRQGFWKTYKEYAALAGVAEATTHGMYK